MASSLSSSEPTLFLAGLVAAAEKKLRTRPARAALILSRSLALLR